jgi:single-stranded-DNA-specific exonuclease
MLEQAVVKVDDSKREGTPTPIVLWSEEWHSGVLGIVASRLVERYRVPAILIAIDGEQGRGSGRSVGGFDLVNALSACADLLGEWGGHKFAVGLNIRRDRLEEFRARFSAASEPALAGMDRRPVLEIEDEIKMVSCDRRLALLCEKLAPFGYENSEPLFASHGVQLLEPPQRTGEQGQHLRLTAYQEGHTRACIGFGLGEMAEAINRPNQRFAMAYVPTINRWRGRETVQLRVKDLKLE